MERIFGKWQWASRTDEILAAQRAADKGDKQLPPPVPVDVEATDVTADKNATGDGCGTGESEAGPAPAGRPDNSKEEK